MMTVGIVGPALRRGKERRRRRLRLCRWQPDLDRLCSAFHERLSHASSGGATGQLDDMFPCYARRIQELLVAYPHVPTNGSCYRRHLVPTRDLPLAVRDAGFEARHALHAMKIELSALKGSGDEATGGDRSPPSPAGRRWLTCHVTTLKFLFRPTELELL
jgi:hypothetical protein